MRLLNLYQKVRIRQLLNRIIPLIIILFFYTANSKEYEGYLIDMENVNMYNIHVYYNYYFLLKEPSELLYFVKDSNDININLLKNGAIKVNLGSSLHSMSCCIIGFAFTSGTGTKEEINLTNKIYDLNELINDKFTKMNYNFNIEEYRFKILKVKVDLCICNSQKRDKIIPHFAIKELIRIEEIQEDSLVILENYFKLVRGK